MAKKRSNRIGGKRIGGGRIGGYTTQKPRKWTHIISVITNIIISGSNLSQKSSLSKSSNKSL